jgi:chorismate synthase
MEQEKIDHLKSILNRLEDIKHTQESVIDKVNHVITDLFQHPDKKLEKAMEDAHQKSSDNIDSVGEVIEELEMRINKAENES